MDTKNTVRNEKCNLTTFMLFSWNITFSVDYLIINPEAIYKSDFVRLITINN